MVPFAPVLAAALLALPADTPRFGGFLAEIPCASDPASVAIDAEDRIYVLESVDARIRVLDPHGVEIRRFGKRGSAPGELLEPRGLAVAPDGEVFVADTGNDRIQVFSNEGELLRGYGSRGRGPCEFNTPLGLAVGADRLWVADSRNHRVQVLARDGRHLADIGGRDLDDGGLDHPSGVAVDAEGFVHVADTDHHRIVSFGPDGRFARAFGGHGPYAGLFLTPSGIREHGGLLYVADRDNHRIQVYERSGELLYEWGVHSLRAHEGGGKLHYPDQVAIAPSGRFAAVVESFEDRVQLFGTETEESRTAQRSQEKNTGAHYGPDLDTAGPTLLLLEPSAPALLVLDVAGEEAVEISRFGRFGSRPGFFSRPEGVAIDPDGRRAYVGDPGLARLSVLDVSRPAAQELLYLPELVRFVKSVDFLSLAAPATEWPIEPGAIVRGASGLLWTIDAANRRIAVLGPSLELRRTLGGTSGEPMLRPTSLALSPSGDAVYVVDGAACRVRVFDAEGGARGSFGTRGDGPTELRRPYGIAAGPDSTLFVTDEAGDKVVVYSPEGRPLRSFGRKGLGRVEFTKPRGIALDAEGRLVVVDWGNHRCQVLGTDGGFVRAFGARLYVQPTLR